MLHVQAVNIRFIDQVKQESNLQKHTMLYCKNYTIVDLSFELKQNQVLFF